MASIEMGVALNTGQVEKRADDFLRQIGREDLC